MIRYTNLLKIIILLTMMIGGIVTTFANNPSSGSGGVISEQHIVNGVRMERLVTEPYHGLKEAPPPYTPHVRPPTTFEFDDPSGTLLWQHSDPTGIGNDVAVADYNDYFGVGYYLNNERMCFFERNSNIPVWEYIVSDGGTYLDISGDGQIVMFSNMGTACRLDPLTGSATWNFILPTGFTSGPVDVSRDGSLIVLLGWGPTSGGINRVWAFRPESSTPIWRVDIDADEASGWYGATISIDNSRVAFNGKFHMYVCDAQTGELLWDGDTYNTESPARLSEDGSILTSASLAGKLRVFYWDGIEWKDGTIFIDTDNNTVYFQAPGVGPGFLGEAIIK